MNDVILATVVKATQEDLFAMLSSEFSKNSIICDKSYIVVKGDAPCLLVAHLDTVHKCAPSVICTSANIWMSPTGIGGDDRCGVYTLLEVYERAKCKPWLLFTCDEEIGGRGALDFVDDYKSGKMPEELDAVKYIIEVDRKGSKDSVFYELDNPEFEDFINKHGFKTAIGSFSDISYIAPAMRKAAVNLSSGYYNPHTQHEYIDTKVLDKIVDKVSALVDESCDDNVSPFCYKKRESRFYSVRDFNDGWHDFDFEGKGGFCDFNYAEYVKGDAEIIEFERTIPDELIDMYDELLDIYTPYELRYLIEDEGMSVIKELYKENFIGGIEDD